MKCDGNVGRGISVDVGKWFFGERDEGLWCEMRLKRRWYMMGGLGDIKMEEGMNGVVDCLGGGKE